MDIPVGEVARAVALRLAPEAAGLEKHDSKGGVAPVTLRAPDLITR
jgi:hypothetical protein